MVSYASSFLVHDLKTFQRNLLIFKTPFFGSSQYHNYQNRKRKKEIGESKP